MPETLKKIYAPNDNLEADLIRDTLEQAGIYCFVQGEQHRSMLGVLGSYVEMGILVPEGQSDQASEMVEDLLKQIQALPPEFKDEDEKQAYEPPPKFRPKSRRVAFVLGLVVPGTGSCYAGRPEIGSWIVAAYFVCLVILSLSMASHLLSDASVFIALMIGIMLSLIPLDIMLAFKALKKQVKEDKHL